MTLWGECERVQCRTLEYLHAQQKSYNHNNSQQTRLCGARSRSPQSVQIDPKDISLATRTQSSVPYMEALALHVLTSKLLHIVRISRFTNMGGGGGGGR